jgi:hypothetical protein
MSVRPLKTLENVIPTPITIALNWSLHCDIFEKNIENGTTFLHREIK